MSDTKVHTSLTAVMRPLGSEPRREIPTCWRQVTLTDLNAVEELLDSLDSAGCTEKQLTVIGGMFVVRWRQSGR
jgi:hypothetical protein